MARLVGILSFYRVMVVVQAAAAGKNPPPVEVPQDSRCKECGMKIKNSTLRFVAEEVGTEGKAEFFCDVGDFFIHYEFEEKEGKGATVYVKDYNTGAWMPGREVFYLSGSKVVTPMRYGILAFKDRQSAESFKKENGGGNIYTFEGVLASKAYRR